jgi:hypothetical protein
LNRLFGLAADEKDREPRRKSKVTPLRRE